MQISQVKAPSVVIYKRTGKDHLPVVSSRGIPIHLFEVYESPMLKNLPSAKVLQTFESAARLGSFTLSAKELFLTQSAISRQIKSLEETLGFEVFIRDNNRLELTENGQIFYSVVSSALSDLSAAVNRLRKGGVQRRLNIALPPTFASRWLAPRLYLFKNHCQATLTILTHKNYSYSSFGDFDCQVGFGSEELGTIGGTILFPEIIIPACTPELKERILANNTLDDIPLLHTLSETSRLPYWEQWIDRCNDPIIKPTAADIAAGIEFSTQDQTIIAAISGLGVAMVDINIASYVLKKGLLHTLGDPVNTIYGYWIFPPRSNKADNDPARMLYDWIREEARQSLMEMSA